MPRTPSHHSESFAAYKTRPIGQACVVHLSTMPISGYDEREAMIASLKMDPLV
jgi:hypothetical protein